MDSEDKLILDLGIEICSEVLKKYKYPGSIVCKSLLRAFFCAFIARSSYLSNDDLIYRYKGLKEFLNSYIDNLCSYLTKEGFDKLPNQKDK